MFVTFFAVVSPLVVVFRFSDVPRTTTVPPPSTPTIEESWLMSRAQWYALPSKRPLTPVTAPWRRAIIIHTVTESCSKMDQCISQMRYIQKLHMKDNNYSDIAYNFVVGGDGRVYEGVGWNFTGRHTPKCNGECLGVAFVGDYRSRDANVKPSTKQVAALQHLLLVGVAEGRLLADYKVIPHCRARATESPGDNLYNEIVTWDQYSPNAGNFSGLCEWPSRPRG